ncbi:hypothetical protein [Streptacidiphilus jiangxiensis]|uniref:Uncharacterized protein n=1 Tax=Streptacidiphilus jiangxiensis TaxID=235985 RepID=A0A1H7T8J1_STRJI|nr:hypothetical protein [Streptacidiphilus jiangxiensis]SEL81200.1 hypothetical protein SAMN05414137_113139 [Streptacidiphilus jiangxiensis]
MSLAVHSSPAPAEGARPGIPPVAWLLAGVAAMAVVRTAEGVVDMAQEVLGIGAYGPDGSPETAARLHAQRAPRELAACLLIAASIYGVHFVRRAAADLRDLARDIRHHGVSA